MLQIKKKKLAENLYSLLRFLGALLQEIFAYFSSGYFIGE